MARIHPDGQQPAREEMGCLPCGNCLVIVPQDRFFALERFGKFQEILEPGLRWAGLDLCGACVNFRSVSSRVIQSFVQISTKTTDNVFVFVHVAVQHTISAKSAEAALYKLNDISEQLDSYVSDVVRSFVPSLTLDECFEKKDEISAAVEEKLKDVMIQYGLEITKALVVNVEPDASVVKSMNEITKQRRLRDAQQMQSEGEQVRTVKAAEAAADAKQLQGEGIARQRRAIIDGIRESITFGVEETLSADEISHLLVVTQYYETLRDVASKNESSIVFLDGSVGAVKDLVGQVRRGMPKGAPGVRKPSQQVSFSLRDVADQREAIDISYYETLRDVASKNESSIVFLDGSVGAVKDLVGQVRRGMPKGAPGVRKPSQQDMVEMELAKLSAS